MAATLALWGDGTREIRFGDQSCDKFEFKIDIPLYFRSKL